MNDEREICRCGKPYHTKYDPETRCIGGRQLSDKELTESARKCGEGLFEPSQEPPPFDKDKVFEEVDKSNKRFEGYTKEQRQAFKPAPVETGTNYLQVVCGCCHKSMDLQTSTTACKECVAKIAPVETGKGGEDEVEQLVKQLGDAIPRDMRYSVARWHISKTQALQAENSMLNTHRERQVEHISLLQKERDRLKAIQTTLVQAESDLIDERTRYMEESQEWRIKCRKLESDKAELVKTLEVTAIRAFNIGYMHGHEDTVESNFTIIMPQDLHTYHRDIVKEMLEDTSLPEATKALQSIGK